MGKRGPLPKPTPLRILEGNRAHRPIVEETPPDQGDCAPPAHLHADSVAIWKQLAPELESKGLLAPRYLPAFEVLCDAIVQYRRAATILARTGPVVNGRNGDVVTNPASREFARYAVLLRNFGSDFGMSPAALTAITKLADAPVGASPARLLGG
jgi:P27 family predicted phage terminase small subunit